MINNFEFLPDKNQKKTTRKLDLDRGNFWSNAELSTHMENAFSLSTSYDNKFFQLLFVFCHKLLWKLKKKKFTGVDLDTRLKLLLQQESHINLFPFFFLKLNQKVCLIQISHTIPSGKWRNSFESNSSHVLDFAMPCCFAVGSGLLYFNAGSSKKKFY